MALMSTSPREGPAGSSSALLWRRAMLRALPRRWLPTWIPTHSCRGLLAAAVALHCGFTCVRVRWDRVGAGGDRVWVWGERRAPTSQPPAFQALLTAHQTRCQSAVAGIKEKWWHLASRAAFVDGWLQQDGAADYGAAGRWLSAGSQFLGLHGKPQRQKEGKLGAALGLPVGCSRRPLRAV